MHFVVLVAANDIQNIPHIIVIHRQNIVKFIVVGFTDLPRVMLGERHLHLPKPKITCFACSSVAFDSLCAIA
ncbi:MAG: hypothetical protein ACI4RJ_05620 [Alphaproteobacteria bacterium]